MPADQIQIRWSTWSGADYDKSMDALKEYDPIPNVKAAVNIKGTMPKEAIDRIMDIVNEFDADASVIMTATWGNNAAPNQLRLFGPNSGGGGRRQRQQRNSAAPVDTDGPQDEIADAENDSEPSPEEVAEANIADVIN